MFDISKKYTVNNQMQGNDFAFISFFHILSPDFRRMIIKSLEIVTTQLSVHEIKTVVLKTQINQ